MRSRQLPINNKHWAFYSIDWDTSRARTVSHVERTVKASCWHSFNPLQRKGVSACLRCRWPRTRTSAFMFCHDVWEAYILTNSYSFNHSFYLFIYLLTFHQTIRYIFKKHMYIYKVQDTIMKKKTERQEITWATTSGWPVDVIWYQKISILIKTRTFTLGLHECWMLN